MLCPVLGEAFINLLILLFKKDEYKTNERMYNAMLREQIDVKISSLHLHCNGFEKPIDINDKRFKDFLTLMNNRNDVLHGNVNPSLLYVDDVWFDNKYIPLFKNDEGLIKRMLRKYCVNVERETALKDYKIVLDFMVMILCNLENKHMEQLVMFMGERMPGINKANNRLGTLFPQVLSEIHI